jgi:hypothetical protein
MKFQADQILIETDDLKIHASGGSDVDISAKLQNLQSRQAVEVILKVMILIQIFAM